MSGRVSYFGGQIKDGLILYLDATKKESYVGYGTTWTDISGWGNNAIVSGATYDVKKYFNLNSDDYFQISDSSSLRPTSFTLDVWFMATTFNSYNTLIVKPFTSPPWNAPYLSYMMRINSNNTFECSLSSNSTYTYNYISYTFSTNTPYNCVFSYNSDGNYSAYVNGGSVANSSMGGGTISYTTFPVLIGASYGTSPVGEFFNGNIYLTKIYNRALTSAEVLTNYNSTKSRFGL